MAAEGGQYPWRWNRGTIFTNLDVILGLLVEIDRGSSVRARLTYMNGMEVDSGRFL